MRNESAKKVSLTSLDNLFGESGSTGTGNKYEAVSVYQLHAFRDHPFRVIDDAAMAELTASIRENGILSPIIVRKSPYEDGYEICAGHRRHHAAIIAGLTEVPVDIRELTDEQAVSLMVDTNIARPEILPSEKAWAYRMKWESQKHQGKHIEGDQLDSTLASENVRTIQRYIRLTYLIKPLMDMVDQKEISLQIGGILSTLSSADQEKVKKVMFEINKLPTKIQADNLVELLKDKDNPSSEDEEREIQNILMGIVELAPVDTDVAAEDLPDNKNDSSTRTNEEVAPEQEAAGLGVEVPEMEAPESLQKEMETKSVENEYRQKDQEERNATEEIIEILPSCLDKKESRLPTRRVVMAFYDSYAADIDAYPDVAFKEALIEKHGKSHHGGAGGAVDFTCSPSGIRLNYGDEIRWSTYVHLVRKYQFQENKELRNKVDSFFPATYSKEEKINIILEFLKSWKEGCHECKK